MSSYSVVITEAAQRDLLNIFDYIAFELREPDSASRLLSKVRSNVKSLEEFPERNNLISEPKYEERKIRWCPVENYIIFYQVSKEQSQVYIVRILCKKRNWEHIITPSQNQ
ncbi:MAG TPA: type II toxin-antitoxin system RelE/ParE family toxin [Clostridiales bacterium]|nr:type II toxin-antitoxin system RelE/ParE family toxin [Clostridiales bacterium]